MYNIHGGRIWTAFLSATQTKYRNSNAFFQPAAALQRHNAAARQRCYNKCKTLISLNSNLICSLLTATAVDIFDWNCCRTLHSHRSSFFFLKKAQLFIFDIWHTPSAVCSNKQQIRPRHTITSLPKTTFHLPQIYQHRSAQDFPFCFPHWCIFSQAARPAEVERWCKLMWSPVCNSLAKWAAGLGKSKKRLILLTILCVCAEEMVVCCSDVFLVNHRHRGLQPCSKLRNCQSLICIQHKPTGNHLPLPSALERPGGQLDAASPACSVPACGSCLLPLVQPYRLPFLPRL